MGDDRVHGGDPCPRCGIELDWDQQETVDSDGCPDWQPFIRHPEPRCGWRPDGYPSTRKGWGEPPVTVTPEMISRALGEMWQPKRRTRVPAMPPDPFCPAKLFAPDESLKLAIKHELIATCTPVHPLHVVHFEPTHGPAPLTCAREPHPDSPWHWDGRGTWWR